MRAADKIRAREAARTRTLLAQDNRRRRGQSEQAALGAFEVALESRQDVGMSAAVDVLVQLGNTVEQIAALTNQDIKEIRRLRVLPERNQ